MNDSDHVVAMETVSDERLREMLGIMAQYSHMEHASLGFPLFELKSALSELLASRLAKQAPNGWLPLPGDLLSHIDDWRSACTIARDAAPVPTEDMDDRSYWQHQLNVLDRVEAQIDDFRAAPSPVGGSVS